MTGQIFDCSEIIDARRNERDDRLAFFACLRPVFFFL